MQPKVGAIGRVNRSNEGRRIVKDHRSTPKAYPQIAFPNEWLRDRANVEL